MNNERSIRVKFLRPLMWGGEARAVGYECSMPALTVRSLARHRAVEILRQEEEGREVGQRSSVEPIPSPRTTAPGKKRAPAKPQGRKV